MSAAKKLFTGALGLVTSLLSGGDEPDVQAPPEAPKPEPVKPMPAPDDAAVKRAKRRSIATQAARGGRASTVLTRGLGGTESGGGKLGGDGR